MENRSLKKYNIQNFIVSLKSSFIELLPYMILFSICVMSKQIFDLFDNLQIYSNILESVILSLRIILPVLLLFVVSANYAKLKNEYISLSAISSMMIYIFFLLIINDYTFKLDNTITIYTLFIPYLSINLLHFFRQLDIFNSFRAMDYELSQIFTYTFPIIITIFLSVSILVIIQESISPITIMINEAIRILPSLLFTPLYILFGHLFWFIGINGTNLADVFFDLSILSTSILPNLTSTSFLNLFTIFGGAGSGLALVIAILINGKDEHWNKISKISLPFVIFNINEILIYGLPIVFNKYLFLPFIFVPIINFFVAYFFLSFGLIEFAQQDVHWAIPTFLNVYIATDGSLLAMVIQFLLLVLSVMIYLPFVNLYVKKQNKEKRTIDFADSLDVSIQLNSHKSKKENEQVSLINKNIKVNKIINLLHENKLLVYYQPKIDIKNNICNNFEALLRLELQDGKVVGPYFLEDLEDDGLAPIIDLWVCKEIKKQFKIWDIENFKPTIGINLHPDTLQETDVVEQIVAMFKTYNVEFEILERAFIDNEDAKKNIQYTINSGFNLSIDDFGTGYTSLNTLNDTLCTTVKLDKSLIDLIQQHRGKEICSRIALLCDTLGFEIVAEGVEQKEQVEILRTMKIKYIQGYYFSPAMPPAEVINYTKKFK